VVEFVNDFKPGILAQVVNATEVAKVVESEGVLAKEANLRDLGGFDGETRFSPELRFFEDGEMGF